MESKNEIKEKVKRKCKEESGGKSKKIKVEIDTSTDFNDSQREEEWLAEAENLDLNVTCNIIQMFDAENTIPFIARYRQHLTNGMAAEKLRHVKESYEKIQLIKTKAENLLKTIVKEEVVDPELVKRVKSARSLEEVELLAAPFKKGSSGTLASRARAAGLEDAGLALLTGSDIIDAESLVSCDTPGRENVNKVLTGLQHILADHIAKEQAVLELLSKLKDQTRITLECTLKETDTSEELKKKYDNYKNFSQDVRNMRDYQVLAINRAENQKVLKVKVNIPDIFWNRVKEFCNSYWLGKGRRYPLRSKVFEDAVKDAIQRLLQPLVTRQIRNNLSEKAERSAISEFARNLKGLLLTPPLKAKVIMAMDPGKANGVKIGMIDTHGQPLLMDKIFLLNDYDRRTASKKLIEWVTTHRCETIAIGNGTFCRETESFLSEMIKNGCFKPLDVTYTIIDEQGVSIYSCSPTATAEFPNTDPTLISAVSLARRIQDPLAELVKVEPRHLGVGMYQHDVPEKKLSASLEEVVSECVSFVGVDVNTASVHLLTHVAGLTKSRAEAIIVWRTENGQIENREQLRKVKGIGAKTFQQCAGFIRILSNGNTSSSSSCNRSEPKKKSAKSKKKPSDTGFNPLDQTEIHPENYSIATRLLEDFGLNTCDIGNSSFISTFKQNLSKTSTSALASEYDITNEQITQITEALTRPTNHDLRSLSQAPLFRRELTNLESLKLGDLLTGVVRNVVQFGAFVDVGVGTDGLIHSSQLGYDRSQWVQLGDRVSVAIISIDARAKRIGLRLSKKD